VSAAVIVHLDEATLGALDRLAEKTDRPRDLLVNEAIEDYVAFSSWSISKIEAGLAAADAGEFASAAEVARVREKFALRE
jgi:predicted transcriptional regulator